MTGISMGGRHAYDGLSITQRTIINWWWETLGLKKSLGTQRKGDSAMTGWYIWRMPTTIHPPTELKLHYRDRNGKLLQAIVITEKGKDRTPW